MNKGHGQTREIIGSDGLISIAGDEKLCTRSSADDLELRDRVVESRPTEQVSGPPVRPDLREQSHHHTPVDRRVMRCPVAKHLYQI